MSTRDTQLLRVTDSYGVSLAVSPAVRRRADLTQDRDALPFPGERRLQEIRPQVHVRLRHREDDLIVDDTPQERTDVLPRRVRQGNQPQKGLGQDVPGPALPHESGRLRPRAFR